MRITHFESTDGVENHSCLKVRKLDWEDTHNEERRPGLVSFLQEANPDLVLGADLVSFQQFNETDTSSPFSLQIYDVSAIPALVNTLALALRSNTADRRRQALIAVTVRNEATLRSFLQEVERAELCVENVPLDCIAESHFMKGHGGQSEGVNAAVRIYKIT